MKTELNKQQEGPNEELNQKDRNRMIVDLTIKAAAKPKGIQNTIKYSLCSNNYESYLCESELQALINRKQKDITSLSNAKQNHQCELETLLYKLNDIISVSSYLEANKASNQHKQKKLEHLDSIRVLRVRDFQKAKSQNKIYKEQYDIYQTRVNGNSSDQLNDLESKIDTFKEDNCALLKRVRDLKNKQNVKSKVLEGYSANIKYPREIKAYTEEIKSLSLKKHDYYTKLNNNKKAVGSCLLQMKKLEELYNKMKAITNLPNTLPIDKIENEINRLNTDLKGNEDDIIQRIDNDEMIIIQEENKRQQLLQSQQKNSKFLKPIVLKNMKQKMHTSHSVNRRVMVQNQQIKGHSPKSSKDLYLYTLKKHKKYNNSNLTIIQNDTGYINNFEERDLSKIPYESLTDFEYRELLTKKEHYFSINCKLENSIKEAKKMYERKLKEMNNSIDQNNERLSYIIQENELLKSEIADLSKQNRLNEEENQIKKEIRSLKPQIAKIAPKEQINTIHNDVSDTRNDILNDLKVLNCADGERNLNKHPTSIIEKDNNNNNNPNVEDKDEEGTKGKFKDIFNVEHIDADKVVNREKALIDIKKKYIQGKQKEGSSLENNGDDGEQIRELSYNEEEKVLETNNQDNIVHPTNNNIIIENHIKPKEDRPKLKEFNLKVDNTKEVESKEDLMSFEYKRNTNNEEKKKFNNQNKAIVCLVQKEGNMMNMWKDNNLSTISIIKQDINQVDGEIKPTEDLKEDIESINRNLNHGVKYPQEEDRKDRKEISKNYLIEGNELKNANEPRLTIQNNNLEIIKNEPNEMITNDIKSNLPQVIEKNKNEEQGVNGINDPSQVQKEIIQMKEAMVNKEEINLHNQTELNKEKQSRDLKKDNSSREGEDYDSKVHAKLSNQELNIINKGDNEVNNPNAQKEDRVNYQECEKKEPNEDEQVAEDKEEEQDAEKEECKEDLDNNQNEEKNTKEKEANYTVKQLKIQDDFIELMSPLEYNRGNSPKYEQNSILAKLQKENCASNMIRNSKK